MSGLKLLAIDGRLQRSVNREWHDGVVKYGFLGKAGYFPSPRLTETTENTKTPGMRSYCGHSVGIPISCWI